MTLLVTRNIVYYRFFRDAGDRVVSFAPTAIRENYDFNTVFIVDSY